MRGAIGFYGFLYDGGGASGSLCAYILQCHSVTVRFLRFARTLYTKELTSSGRPSVLPWANTINMHNVCCTGAGLVMIVMISVGNFQRMGNDVLR